jgi:hypothetical protein
VPEETRLGIRWATISACLNKADYGGLKLFDDPFGNEFNDLAIGLSWFEELSDASWRN